MNKQETVKAKTVSTRATYQDVIDAPENMVAELIDGKLYTHTRPRGEHAMASGGLFTLINSAFGFGIGGPGGWWIVYEHELHFGDDVVVPDISGWRRERMPDPPAGPYSILAPDWVCEVLSDSTRKIDLTIKSQVYADAGVEYYWIVDPDARSLEAFKLTSKKWVSIGKLFGDAKVSLPPFEAITFDLGDLWPHSWPPHTVHKDTPGRTTTENETMTTVK